MKKATISFSILLFFLCNFLVAQVKVISSNPENQWTKTVVSWDVANEKLSADIIVNEKESFQKVEGWGACFNERGWKAIQYLPKVKQEELMLLLFSNNGTAFNYCRMPIGASDYALDYYSLNDTKNDYNMDNFSIERDRKYLLPYIKSAIKINPSLKVWGSPWTPPAWMKENNHYAKGKIKMDSKTLESYALYFQKYVEAYRSEGVDIVAVHPQNEPLHLPIFPSCGWSGEQLNVFIRDYLGPRFKKNLPDCEIWLGTINGNDETNEFSEYVATVFGDKETSNYLTGVGFQWFGDSAVEQTVANFPKAKIMQTETKCGWGSNNWAYAFETYNQMVWYLERNASYYSQWNMVLNETGMSSWGWKQNAMISVNTLEKDFKINPQFWAVRHFTQFVKPEAHRISCETKKEIQATAYRNANGELIVVTSNQTNFHKELIVQVQNRQLKLELNPNSINTLVIE